MNSWSAISSISQGDHGCLIFNSPEEQAQATAPFLAVGLERGERSLFVGAPPAVERVRGALKDAGVDVETECRRSRLILTSERDYLEGGRWNTERMLEFLQTAYDAAMGEGFPVLRATGDVSWQVGPENDFTDVVHYESLLDLFFIGKRMVGMCQYPTDRCPPETLVGILSTHKIAAADASVCPNFHYVPPQLLLEKDHEMREKKRAEWMMSQLLRAQRAEEDRERVMKELIDEKRELERVGREKAALQEQLFQAQKMEAVGRLAGGVAHDFNNLLTAILGLADFSLRDVGPAHPARGDIGEIKETALRAARLTRQLLAFSRRQIIAPRAVDLNGLVQNAERMLRRVLGADIDLSLRLSARRAVARVDPGQIEQVILNLAINARDAMPEGGKLTIETGNAVLDQAFVDEHPGASSGEFVLLAVSDEGGGIPEEIRPHLFEPFFTTKEQGKGTGLGLASCYGIVKQNGGYISVENGPGRGTAFKVYLPRMDAAPAVQPPVEGADKPSRGSETVLVAEDDGSVRGLAVRVLRTRGYKVLEAADGGRALEIVKEDAGRKIGLLVVDAVMPRLGGKRLADAVAAVRPDIKVLFISGYTDETIARHGILESGIAFLAKPFTPETLAQRVRAALDER